MASSTDGWVWKLRTENGRQWWDQVVGERQDHLERYQLGVVNDEDFPRLPKAHTALAAARKGLQFYTRLQSPEGHWANDYGGPMFLMPGLLIVAHLTGRLRPAERRAPSVGFARPDGDFFIGQAHAHEMIRYLVTLQNDDGGWGLHIESKSTIFGSALSYVSLRLLGLPPDHPTMQRGRAFLKSNGGAKGIPSWGKFWLAVLGVYDWNGLNPIPPELWLLPYAFPAFPGRYWCHCRMVYLPMSYIYAQRITAPLSPLITALRDELYDEAYASIDWNGLRGHVSPLDMYTPHPLFLRVLNRLLKCYEDVHASGLRQRSLDVVIEHVHNEDDCTLDIDIGPVNKAMNMLVVWHADGPDSARFARHAARIPDYLWLAGDGMKMQGYNGSQLWDTAFSVQAVFACPELADEFSDCLQRAHHYLDVCQVVDETKERERWYRHQSKGAWPFSTRDHGWPISDCTAEGLKTALLLADWRGLAGAPLAKERLFDAVDVVLSLQNTDGGWATYELKRGADLLEVLNPSEVFHGIMVDYPYVECTSACLQALARFRRRYPYYRPDDVDRAMRAGAVFIMRSQRPDGSWYGSWAVCFTYATWFGVLGLLAAGVAPAAVPIARAVAFLESKQLPDGGWGETFASCETMQYVHSDVSQVVNTAWAMLTLIAARYPDPDRLHRAARLLIDRQQDNGNWLQEGISGVFNANCAISYSAYKNYFPIWALGAYHVFTSPAPRL